MPMIGTEKKTLLYA